MCSSPLKSDCRAYDLNKQQKIPVQTPKQSKSFETIGVGIIRNSSGLVLIDQRLNEGLLGGLWEFPGGKKNNDESIEQTISREIKEELGILVLVDELLISFEHSYSHKQLHFVVHLCQLVSGEPKPLASQQVRWVDPDDLNEYPFPAANVKMIAAFKKYLLKDKLIQSP